MTSVARTTTMTSHKLNTLVEWRKKNHNWLALLKWPHCRGLSHRCQWTYPSKKSLFWLKNATFLTGKNTICCLWRQCCQQSSDGASLTAPLPQFAHGTNTINNSKFFAKVLQITEFHICKAWIEKRVKNVLFFSIKLIVGSVAKINRLSVKKRLTGLIETSSLIRACHCQASAAEGEKNRHSQTTTLETKELKRPF